MVDLTPQQDTAVRTFSKWYNNVAKPFRDSGSDDIAPYYIQQGYAGTGKSTTLPFFIEACGLKPEEVTFLAPTGKAAKVMTAKLRDQGFTKPAITIHKAIYRPKGLKYQVIEQQIEALHKQLMTASPLEARELNKMLKILHKDLDRAYDRTAPSFQLNPEAPEIRAARLVVVDEASMVGETIADDLLSFGTPVLSIGDPGQLQPVGDNPGFFIRPADHVLTEIHRQALDNPIIWASKQIREGRDLKNGVYGDGQLRIIDRKNDDVTYAMDQDVQIIVGKNDTRHRITRKIRKLSGLDARGPSVGELMIVTKNSQKHPNLVNGTQLIVTNDTEELKSGAVTCSVYAKDSDGFPYKLSAVQGILEENYLGARQWTASKQAVIHAMQDKECTQLDWSYAITCHKSQGSQWDNVCVHDESGVFRDQAKEWLYTAVTRAAETLTIVR